MTFYKTLKCNYRLQLVNYKNEKTNEYVHNTTTYTVR